MALEWQLPEPVERFWTPAGEHYKLNIETEVLIWRMMHTEVGWELTEKNAEEFYIRAHFLDKLWEPLASKMVGENYVEVYVTPHDVREHIGLKVNVAPVSRAKWVKRIMDTEAVKSRLTYRTTLQVEDNA